MHTWYLERRYLEHRYLECNTYVLAMYVIIPTMVGVFEAIYLKFHVCMLGVVARGSNLKCFLEDHVLVDTQEY